MSKIFIAQVSLLLVSFLSFGQTKNVQATLDTIALNTEKLNFLQEVVNTEWRSSPQNLIEYAHIYDSISKLIGSQKYDAKSLNIKGMASYVTEDYNEAISYYLESLRMLGSSTLSKELAQLYSNLASCFIKTDDFKNAEKYYLLSREIASNLKDEKWVANVNNNLSILYMNYNLYQEADEILEKAIHYYLKKNDSINAGIAYMNQGNSKIFNNDFSGAVSSYSLSKLYVSEKQIPLLHAVSNTGMGIAYTKQKQFSLALPLLKSGTAIAKKINHVEQLIESYNAFADYYSEKNEFHDAYKTVLESQKLKDSVIAATQDQNMAEALTKYETEKKDAQLKVLSLETEKAAQEKRLYLMLALAGLLVAALVGFFLYKNKKKNTLLAKQKQLLEASVDEKNVLLKETHHRVKNSFQIVSSLLYLQSENIVDKEAKIAMKEAQNRVRSMVLIHQKLYSKDQLVGINTKEYFTDLAHDIFESHQFEGKKINYSLNVTPIVLDIETITPLGLILNEMITNVIKHAFTSVSEESHMEIRFSKQGNELLLEVEDNGIGMPSEIKDSSFGIQLITALAKKLKAKLTFPKKTKGTIASLQIIRFKEL
ncbi:tetratricopeptide repeat-containing sensor histidine kinase [Ulvibacter litoralis]|uniref:histidine kinase n=1 Tax=Ulvibacter litoralis TaxID=227084 RepID=A0A1G7DRA6_9FLAO|nr:histidine kinase dimerization/phosphoacceptor domain -containing protein [Ulvibacter litoralis]GHC42582.1 hypothetical protein GCM10008083_00870 [Ulvibacter litoralis]SDE54064.1 Two-component sensor histidine kinase, contains HisKA and HATPase domains [Ulvibacter litoralis]